MGYMALAPLSFLDAHPKSARRAPMKTLVCVFAFLASLLIAVQALAHGGGLDAYGCHHNRKPGATTAIEGR
jgi:hypothetical protein